MNTLCEQPTFTMLVGIPGSGKSTYAMELYNNRNEYRTTTKYFSSDLIRKELWGDENCQDNPSAVFSLMQSRALEAIKQGYSVIYDATNITRKDRRGILNRLPSEVTKECIIVWAPIDVCIQRASSRERVVPEEVIKRMLSRFEAPFYDEGFDYIGVQVTHEFNLRRYQVDAVKALHIPHDNPHHNLNIYEHCRACFDYLDEHDAPSVVMKAGFWHDIGKPFTKTFTNRKGEPCDIAHYYGHAGVGAWIIYGLYPDDIMLAWLISTHMAPFTNQKYYNSLNPEYKSLIDLLHTADKAAH